MPTKHRRLIKELSQTDDPIQIVLLTHELISDVFRQVRQKTSVPFHLNVTWHPRADNRELYEQIPWRKKDGLNAKSTRRYLMENAAESTIWQPHPRTGD